MSNTFSATPSPSVEHDHAPESSGCFDFQWSAPIGEGLSPTKPHKPAPPNSHGAPSGRPPLSRRYVPQPPTEPNVSKPRPTSSTTQTKEQSPRPRQTSGSRRAMSSPTGARAVCSTALPPKSPATPSQWSPSRGPTPRTIALQKGFPLKRIQEKFEKACSLFVGRVPPPGLPSEGTASPPLRARSVCRSPLRPQPPATPSQLPPSNGREPPRSTLSEKSARQARSLERMQEEFEKACSLYVRRVPHPGHSCVVHRAIPDEDW